MYGFYTQRAKQCRDRNLAIPLPMLNRNVPLQTIADKTQEMKRTLAAAGAWPRADSHAARGRRRGPAVSAGDEGPSAT